MTGIVYISPGADRLHLRSGSASPQEDLPLGRSPPFVQVSRFIVRLPAVIASDEVDEANNPQDEPTGLHPAQRSNTFVKNSAQAEYKKAGRSEDCPSSFAGPLARQLLPVVRLVPVLRIAHFLPRFDVLLSSERCWSHCADDSRTDVLDPSYCSTRDACGTQWNPPH